MMCSKTVTSNESKHMVINSVQGPESMELLHPCKSHQSSRMLMDNIVCTVGSALFKATARYLFM